MQIQSLRASCRLYEVNNNDRGRLYQGDGREGHSKGGCGEGEGGTTTRSGTREGEESEGEGSAPS
jgi:hypothetical protein